MGRSPSLPGRFSVSETRQSSVGGRRKRKKPRTTPAFDSSPNTQRPRMSMRAIPVLKLTRSPQGLASIERLLRLRDDLMTAVTIGIGSLELEEGGTIPDCQLAVATHGTLNAAK